MKKRHRIFERITVQTKFCFKVERYWRVFVGSGGGADERRTEGSIFPELVGFRMSTQPKTSVAV